MQDAIYKIMRYRENGTPRREAGYMLQTLDQARAICSQEDTHKMTGKNQWFLGYTKA